MYKKWLAVHLLCAFLVSGLWLVSTIAGWLPFVAFVGVLVAVAKSDPDSKAPKVPKLKLARFNVSHLAVGALVCLPPFLHLALSWNNEFPFAGDHDHHLRQSQAALSFWKVYLIPVLAVIAASWYALRKNSSSLVPAAAVVGFGAVGAWVFHRQFSVDTAQFVLRYPGTVYFAAIPIGTLASVFHWQNPIDALRLTSVLCLPAWLYCLRPKLIGKWPGWEILPFAAFFFFQKDVAYYLASSYLEPWALIFILLAAEHLLLFGDEKLWITYLLLGVSAIIKEHAGLVLIAVVVVTFPYRKPARKKWETLLAAVAAIAPWAFFIVARGSGGGRSVEPAAITEVFDFSRVGLLLAQLIREFSWLTPAVAAVLALLVTACWRKSPVQRASLALLGGALGLAAFFYCDKISIPWTGYARFNLIPLTLIGGATLLPLGKRWVGAKNFRAITLVSAGLVTLNAFQLVPFLAASGPPGYRLNFFEHTDSPLYFPVRTLMKQADPATIKSLLIVSEAHLVHPWLHYDGFGIGYPDVVDRLPVHGILGKESGEQCRCAKDSEGVLAVFPFFAGYLTGDPRMSAVRQAATACRQTLEASCKNVVNDSDQGQLTGALGWGVKP